MDFKARRSFILNPEGATWLGVEALLAAHQWLHGDSEDREQIAASHVAGQLLRSREGSHRLDFSARSAASGAALQIF